MKKACVVCGRRGPDVEPCYFRVVGGTYLVMAAVVRWVNLRCHCCPACFEQGRSISRFRLRAVLPMVFGPLALMLIGYGMSLAGLREAGFAVLYSAALVFMVLLVAVPIFIHFGTRRRVREFLGPELEERLRDLAGIPRWGFTRHVVVLRDIPEKESWVELPDGAGDPSETPRPWHPRR